jgi:hypothetical protein
MKGRSLPAQAAIPMKGRSLPLTRCDSRGVRAGQVLPDQSGEDPINRPSLVYFCYLMEMSLFLCGGRGQKRGGDGVSTVAASLYACESGLAASSCHLALAGCAAAPGRLGLAVEAPEAEFAALPDH